jgi:hypothetical protein
MIFYAAIVIFGVFFFFYFYRQASITENDFTEVKIIAPKPAAGVGIKIDLKLFDSDKFRDLRSDPVPVQVFQSGKRNPFEPY